MTRFARLIKSFRRLPQRAAKSWREYQAEPEMYMSPADFSRVFVIIAGLAAVITLAGILAFHS